MTYRFIENFKQNLMVQRGNSDGGWLKKRIFGFPDNWLGMRPTRRKGENQRAQTEKGCPTQGNSDFMVDSVDLSDNFMIPVGGICPFAEVLKFERRSWE